MQDRLSSSRVPPATQATQRREVAATAMGPAIGPADGRVQALQRMGEMLNAGPRVAALNALSGRLAPPDRTGLGAALKAGTERLSGLSMDDVRVHRNSPKPAQLKALAYTQGTDIHLAPGQERHLPHEAWHVVQQKQGRVGATTQLRGIGINDDTGLEREADVMGARAGQPSLDEAVDGSPMDGNPADRGESGGVAQAVVQRFVAQTYSQAIGVNAPDRQNVDAYAALVTAEFNTALDLYKHPGAVKGAAYAAMFADRTAYFVAYAQARNNLHGWDAVRDPLNRWAQSTNLALEKAKYDAIARRVATARNFCRDSHLTGREMYRNMAAAWGPYHAAYTQAAGDHQWAAVQPHLELLETATAIVESRTADHSPDLVDEYGNGRADSWANANEALTTLHAVAGQSNLPAKRPMNPPPHGDRHPDIPTMAWSAVRDQLPSAQRALIQDIHLSWRLGRAMDKRDATARADREKNSNVQGALRSWHVNEQRQLPDISAQPIPANATALDQDYRATGRHPYKKDRDVGPADGPVGYAEYTGTGIKDDTHFSKIVFDYKSGLVYVTVTHYGLWTPGQDGPHAIGDKSVGSGTNSAWFAIDMTR